MFSEKKEKTPHASERNLIGKKTTITGEVVSEGDFRIDGSVEGTITTSGKVVLGKSGTVTGKIVCSNADIEGRLSGELVVSNLLSVKASADISGELTISKLAVAPGAAFNATCTMKSSVKELRKENVKKEKTAS
ncbi:MAG: polymer-forming cytoskeletal protein [Lutibacter sp.]|jgi:cytoskeletal protein CcmA (bactofilin family)|nr:polymer-forming cytoskeletal protein [Lutibacter sp.]